jgi:hypothetical protein
VVWVSTLIDLSTDETVTPGPFPLATPEEAKAALADLPLAAHWQREAPSGVAAVLFSPDGRRALTLGNGFVNVWALDGVPRGGPRP